MTTTAKRHYIAMAGLRGCIPSVCFSTNTVAAAAESLGSIHESTWVTRELKRHHYVSLNPHKHGNEYAEVIACYCDDMFSHNDN